MLSQYDPTTQEFVPDNRNFFAKQAGPPTEYIGPAEPQGRHIIGALASLLGLSEWQRGERAGVPESAPGVGYNAIGDILGWLDPEIAGGKAVATKAAESLPYLAGVQLFKDRPALWDIVSRAAGKAFKNKWAKDVEGGYVDIAPNVLNDYFMATGSKPAKIGLENEVRTTRDLVKRGRLIKNKAPGLQFKDEPVLGEREWSPQRYPVELVNRYPMGSIEEILKGLTDLNTVAQEAGAKGGFHGGGLHVNVSPPYGEKWTPESAKKFIISAAQSEPYYYPPVASYKRYETPTGEREYVKPFWDKVRSENWTDFEDYPGDSTRQVLDSLVNASNFDDFYSMANKKTNILPKLWEGIRSRRVELRAPLAHEDITKSLEDILFGQALWDWSQSKGRNIPSSVEDLLGSQSQLIDRLKNTIPRWQRGYYKNEGGINEAASPYANRLLDPSVYDPVRYQFKSSELADRAAAKRPVDVSPGVPNGMTVSDYGFSGIPDIETKHVNLWEALAQSNPQLARQIYLDTLPENLGASVPLANEWIRSNHESREPLLGTIADLLNPGRGLPNSGSVTMHLLGSNPDVLDTLIDKYRIMGGR